MAAPQKQYGLITRKKPTTSLATSSVFGAAAPARRLAAFASDSDDDSDDGRPSSSGPTKVNLALGQLQQRQILKAQEAAVSADPTIYQYDELYDDIKEQRDVQKVRKPEDKKPKYIERLLVTAETRKREYERRIERQVQKERELEGEEFADKESFVTSSYRAKLEEMKAAEALEKRDEYLEAIGDVTKQRDLGGFYRHLYEQKMGAEEEGGAKEVKKPDWKETKDVNKKERTYRKRTASEAGKSDEDEAEEADKGSTSPVKKSHIQSNLDADSDFSIDSSDSESEMVPEVPGNSKDSLADVFAKPHPKLVGPNPNPNSDPSDKPSEDTKKSIETIDSQNGSSHPEDEVEVAIKVKVNIWQKRTIGDVLLGAIQRYYERKVAREAQ